MLDPSTRLKANDETLPQQLDYLKEEFGVNDVTIDFSGYPSFTAFTDQLWDYCQAGRTPRTTPPWLPPT